MVGEGRVRSPPPWMTLVVAWGGEWWWIGINLDQNSPPPLWPPAEPTSCQPVRRRFSQRNPRTSECRVWVIARSRVRVHARWGGVWRRQPVFWMIWWGTLDVRPACEIMFPAQTRHTDPQCQLLPSEITIQRSWLPRPNCVRSFASNPNPWLPSECCQLQSGPSQWLQIVVPTRIVSCVRGRFDWTVQQEEFCVWSSWMWFSGTPRMASQNSPRRVYFWPPLHCSGGLIYHSVPWRSKDPTNHTHESSQALEQPPEGVWALSPLNSQPREISWCLWCVVWVWVWLVRRVSLSWLVCRAWTIYSIYRRWTQLRSRWILWVVSFEPGSAREALSHRRGWRLEWPDRPSCGLSRRTIDSVGVDCWLEPWRWVNRS